VAEARRPEDHRQAPAAPRVTLAEVVLLVLILAAPLLLLALLLLGLIQLQR